MSKPSLLDHLLAPFAWRTVREKGGYAYQENDLTGARRAVRLQNKGYTPCDLGWVETGGWTPSFRLEPYLLMPRPVARQLPTKAEATERVRVGYPSAIEWFVYLHAPSDDEEAWRERFIAAMREASR